MTHLRNILLLALIGILAACGAGAPEKPSSEPQDHTKTVTMPLDEKNLQLNLASHFSKTLAAQEKNEPGTDSMTLTPTDFIIEEKQPVQIGPNTYFAIKVVFKKKAKTTLDQLFPLRIVTDPTGTLLFETVIDIREGKEAILSKAPTVSRIIFPDSVTPAIHLTGEGDTDIIFISDPFCGYCRKGYAFIRAHLSEIRNVKIAHNPLSPQTGSAVATWVMEYALGNNIQPADIVKFSYTDLHPISAIQDNGIRLTPTDVSLRILAQYKEHAPELFMATHGELMPFYELLINQYAAKMIAAQSELKRAGFTSSPFFIVNETLIQGMDSNALENALGGQGTVRPSASHTICKEGDTENCM